MFAQQNPLQFDGIVLVSWNHVDTQLHCTFTSLSTFFTNLRFFSVYTSTINLEKTLIQLIYI